MSSFEQSAESVVAGTTVTVEASAAVDAATGLSADEAGSAFGSKSEGMSVTMPSGTANNNSFAALAATGDPAREVCRDGAVGAGAAPIAFTICRSNCAVEGPEVTEISKSHGPWTDPGPGTIEAKPSCVVAAVAVAVPRITGVALPWTIVSPSTCKDEPGGMRTVMVLNTTVAPITGLAAVEPSVTRMTSGWKDFPAGTT